MEYTVPPSQSVFSPELADGHLLEKCKISIVNEFSQGGENSSECRRALRGLTQTLDAPAVALGVFQCALHLFSEDLSECRAADGSCSRFGNIRGAVSTGENAMQ